MVAFARSGTGFRDRLGILVYGVFVCEKAFRILDIVSKVGK